MDHNVAKGISILILFVLTILFGWLPIWLHHRGLLTATGSPRRKLVLDILNCFAGGVFLGTCLLHLLAEGREEFEEYKEQVHFDFDFPFYETVAAVGLFLVAIVEKIGFAIMSFSNQRKEKKDKSACQHGGSPPVVYTPTGSQSAYGALSDSHGVPVMSTPAVTFADSSNGSYQNGGFTDGDSTFQNGKSPAPSVVEGQFVSVKDGSRRMTSSLKENPIEVGQQGSDPRCHHSLTSSLEKSNQDQGHTHGMADREHHHHHHSLMASTSCEPADISQLSVMRAFLLLVALSFHTVFDGLAVGLQGSAAEVWGVLAAIAIHKSLVAFCLGLELAVATKPLWKRPLVFMFLFALISPVGIAIGMGVTSGHVNTLAQLLVSSILQALATGTFLYVTFFEILGQQFAHSHQAGTKTWVELVKVAVTVVGFACMAAVKLLDRD